MGSGIMKKMDIKAKKLFPLLKFGRFPRIGDGDGEGDADHLRRPKLEFPLLSSLCLPRPSYSRPLATSI